MVVECLIANGDVIFMLIGLNVSLAEKHKIGELVGALFSLAQQARGAHFLSHDIVSALIAWLICLALSRLIILR